MSSPEATRRARKPPDRWGDYLHFRCGPEFAAWLDGLCRRGCRNRSQTMHLALARLAESLGFEPPPPRMGAKQGHGPPIGRGPGDWHLPARRNSAFHGGYAGPPTRMENPHVWKYVRGRRGFLARIGRRRSQG